MENRTPDKAELPIGVFDSGLGGLSVLREILHMLPGERYIYYGDSANAPYGVRSKAEVKKLTFEVAKQLIKCGIKALVIACNTATSAAVESLRKAYPELIVVSIEPAIKPACTQNPQKKVLVMATPFTLKEDKFLKLSDRFAKPDQIIKVPCDGLVEFIERGELDSEALRSYLDERLKPYLSDEVKAVVLGCTHYPFIRDTLQSMLPEDVMIYDGGEGTARELKRRLRAEELLVKSTAPGRVTIINSAQTGYGVATIQTDGTVCPLQAYDGLIGQSIRFLNIEMER